MKIKENFILRELCGNYIVVAVGAQTLDFQGLIKLNECGAFLWKQMADTDVTEEALLQALLAEYDVDEARAKADLEAFIHSLKEADLLV